MSALRYVKIRHDFKFRDVTLAFVAAVAAFMFGPWAVAAALLVLVATDNVTISLTGATVDQELEVTP